jgi:hypothetical protein
MAYVFVWYSRSGYGGPNTAICGLVTKHYLLCSLLESFRLNINSDVRDGPINHEHLDSAVFANKSGLLLVKNVGTEEVQVWNETTNEMVKNSKTRQVGPYVTLLGLKTENKAQSKVSSVLPSDRVFAFGYFRPIAFSRLAGSASHVFAYKIGRFSAKFQKKIL